MNEHTFSPLAPVDYVLEQVGLPRLDPILQKIAPKNVLGNCAQIPDIGAEIEDKLDGIACLPKLPKPKEI